MKLPRLLRLLRPMVISDLDGQPYLRRWTLPLPFGRAIMLHHIMRADWSRQLHDHPWNFLTLVLAGAYTEEFRRPDGAHGWRFNGPWRVRGCRAEHAHAVRMVCGDGCWTLVFRGRRRRQWGFYTEIGWQRWDSYLRQAGFAVVDEDA